jgi:hypothetical protein
MITKFRLFTEAVTLQDTKNSLELGIEMQNKQSQQQTQQQNQNPNQINKQDPGLQKNANIKISDLQKTLEDLNRQKMTITQELTKLQDAQRELAPTDPKQLKLFQDEQKAKITNSQNLIKAFDDRIKIIQGEIARNKAKYL